MKIANSPTGAVESLDPGSGDIAVPAGLEQRLNVLRGDPRLADMFQDVLTDDESEPPSIESRMDLGKVRTDVDDPVDVGAGFDVDADEFVRRKKLPPSPGR
jgi:hypothetical protein